MPHVLRYPMKPKEGDRSPGAVISSSQPRATQTNTDMANQYHFEMYSRTMAFTSMNSDFFCLAMACYLTVRAITSEAITDAALTTVDITVNLNELFWLYFEFA